MFKFEFQLDETETEQEENAPSSSPNAGPSRAAPAPKPKGQVKPCHHVSLSELLSTLPPTLTYSPLPLPLPGLSQPLLRRDLHDARFQLASDSSTTDADVDEYADAGTDLIPGVYEGGLKSWEGGGDLVEVLRGGGEGKGLEEVGGWIRGSKVLEVGCGTALPTSFLLHSLLSSSPAAASTTTRPSTVLHLQDYNLPVLRLVTLPNLLLAALPFIPPDYLASPDNAVDEEDVMVDLERGGELEVTDKLKEGFASVLEKAGVELRFTWGDWTGFAEELASGGGEEGQETERGYDLVMTAETIYSEGSVEALAGVLRHGVRGRRSEMTKQGEGKEEGRGEVEVEIEDGVRGLSVGTSDQWRRGRVCEMDEGVCLVAAKVLYFGVGGGLQDFISLVHGQGGWSEVVREWVQGVGRKVVRVGW